VALFRRINRPEDFRNAALLVERREVEGLQLEGGPVDVSGVIESR